MTINLVTLGCSKNLVDSEKILRQLKDNGHNIYHDAAEYTDVVIINTCGFILDAKTESIETILSYAEAKKEGFINKLYVMGCLSQRYKDSLKKEIPEVDDFFGISEHERIVKELEGRFNPEILNERFISTPSHYAYLKVSEGCNRKCAFCAIPGIRGPQVSLHIEELIEEAEFLAREGVKELILIAQDLSSYGTDIYKIPALPELLDALVKIDGFEWIRLHYLYPSGNRMDDIVRLMKEYPKICPYLDIPIQHASNKILKEMQRGHHREDIERMISKFREDIPEIAIRSTVITGFPGEGEKEYAELKEFVEALKFDRLGVFGYSHEEHTPAFNKFKDSIPEKTMQTRMEDILKVQEEISFRKNLAKIGKKYKVLIDRKEGQFYYGRTVYDSPEVDNGVLIPAEHTTLKVGHFYMAEVFDALEFDLYARIVE